MINGQMIVLIFALAGISLLALIMILAAQIDKLENKIKGLEATLSSHWDIIKEQRSLNKDIVDELDRNQTQHKTYEEWFTNFTKHYAKLHLSSEYGKTVNK